MNRVDRSSARAFVLAMGVLLGGTSPQAAPFLDEFDVAGARLDLSRWTTEIGPSSFLGGLSFGIG